MSIISFNNVSKSFHNKNLETSVLKNISFRIEKGQSVVITGPSGSGKTTLIHLIAGFIEPDFGEVTILDHKLNFMNEKEKAVFRKRNIGLVFQELNLIPILNVYQNIELPLLIDNCSKKDISKRVNAQLEKAGLKHLQFNYPQDLSSGEQQRVALLRALVIKPEILLLDEPTSRLDHQNSLKFINFLIELNEAEKTTLILSTHDSAVKKFFTKEFKLVDGCFTPLTQ